MIYKITGIKKTALGGNFRDRFICRAKKRLCDKTNGYDAVYYNEVIKPALVGLAGPWISGGIEFKAI
ncbi:MAG: DUF5107 domain-containing protein [Clostridiales bacterium]|nr:DUF5107 domain-containing protein [Clostridiales bacterium]